MITVHLPRKIVPGASIEAASTATCLKVLVYHFLSSSGHTCYSMLPTTIEIFGRHLMIGLLFTMHTTNYLPQKSEILTLITGRMLLSISSPSAEPQPSDTIRFRQIYLLDGRTKPRLFQGTYLGISSSRTIHSVSHQNAAIKYDLISM